MVIPGLTTCIHLQKLRFASVDDALLMPEEVSWAHRTTLKQVGLKGEAMNLISLDGTSSVEWIRGSLATRSRQSMTWYKVHRKAEGAGKWKGDE